MPFRFSATRVSLTYPNANFDMQGFMDHVKSAWSLLHVIVCHELHQNGESHRHAYLQFAKRPNFLNERVFDYTDCHPNIQQTKNPAAWQNYCRMEGNFLEWKKDETTDMTLEEACDNSTTIQEWMEYCHKNRVNSVIMDRFWMLKGKLGTITEEDVILGTMKPELGLLNISNFDKPVVLIGPTELGKVINNN